MNVGHLQLSSGNYTPNSGNKHHLTIPFEGGMNSFKRQGACVKGKAAWNELDYRVDVCTVTKGAPVRYVTKIWSVVLLNKKNTYFLLLSVGLPVANAPDVLQPCDLLYDP